MRSGLVILGLLALGAAFVAGCLLLPESKMPRPVAEALDAPDKFYLYSLEPSPLGVTDAIAKTSAETFHGHVILGEMEIRDAVTRRKLVAAFNRGVSDHDGSVAACFIPHHGIRIQKGKHVVDLVICFKCAQVQTYYDGDQTEMIAISTSPRAVFNEVLDRAHIPLSKDAR
jgi:hypothetical protein